MAVNATIIEQPYPIDFAKNSPEFVISSNKILQQGHIPHSQYDITGLPSIGTDISLQFCGKTLGFTVYSTSMANKEGYRLAKYQNIADLKQELDLKWGNNYYVNQHFNVTSILIDADNDNVFDTIRMTFTGKTQGKYEMIISDWSNPIQPTIFNSGGNPGADIMYHDNFKIFSQFEIERTKNGSTEIITTSELYFELGNDNKVHIPLSIPSSYLECIDKPTLNENFGAYELHYLFLKYRLNYAVAKGQFDMLVNIIRQTPFKYLINGKLSSENRSLNEPDWHDTLGTVGSTLSNYAHARSYGCPSGLRISSFEGMYQWAYFIFNDESQLANASNTMTVSVDILETDGTQINNNIIGAITMTNHSVVRIPLSAAALNISNISTKVLSYTVKVSNTNSKTWERTFIMNEKPYFSKIFLFQNKYGVLESFFIDNELTEHTVEGEEVVQGKRYAVSKTDIKTVFTARTGYKSREEMTLLKSAVSQTHNYKVVNEKLTSITILPDTFEILDESLDLQSAEFRYVVNENVESGYKETAPTWNDLIDSAIAKKWEDANVFFIKKQ